MAGRFEGTSRVPITDRQAELLGFIRYYIGEHGYPPTVREIGAVLGIRSTNGVDQHLMALEKKGFVTRGPHRRSRSIRLTDKTSGAPDRGSREASNEAGTLVTSTGVRLARVDVELVAPARWDSFDFVVLGEPGVRLFAGGGSR